jgi:hypothetical protein
MAGNGEGGRGTAASKKRQGTKASKAVRGKRSRATHRSENRTRRALEPFLNRNAHIPAHVYLAEIVKVEGNHMDVLTKDGDTKTVRISGSATVPRAVYHRMEGSEHHKMYVIVDGGDVVGNVPSHRVAQVKKRVGWPKGSHLDTIFEKNENNGGGGGGGSTRRRSRR